MSITGILLGLLIGAAVALSIVQLIARSGHRELIVPEEQSTGGTRFQALVEGSSDLIALIASDGTLLYSSSSITTILGYPPSYNIGQEIWHLVHPEDLSEAWTALTRSVEGRDDREGTEVRLRHADGTWRWMEARGTNRINDPAVRGVVVVCRDITERKLFEHRLEEGAARASQILDATSDAIVVLNESGHVVLFNKAAQTTFGHGADEIRGKAFSDLFAPRVQGPGGPGAKLEAALSPDASGAETHILQMRRGNGEEFTAELTRSMGRLGKRWVNVLVVRDVSPRMAIQQALVEAEETLRRVFESSPMATLVVGQDGQVNESNEAARGLFGLSEVELETKKIRDLISPDRVADIETAMRDLLKKKEESAGADVDICGCGGQYTPSRWLMARLDGVIGARRGSRQLVCQIEDLSREATRTKALIDAERRFETAFEAAPVGMALVDFAERRVFVNAALKDLLGEDDSASRDGLVEVVCGPGEIDRRAFASLIGAASVEGFELDLGRLCRGEISEFKVEESLVHSSGREIPSVIGVSLVRDDDEAPYYLIAQVEDMTEQKRRESDLARAATHDALTGLANRALFVERLGQALARGARHGSGVAVLFCDLDNLKLVNDQYGHAVGDEVLAALAFTISQAVRTEDLVARFGGDEFVVLCEDLAGESEACAVAERIVTSVARGADVSVGHLNAAITVGIAVVGGHERPGQAIRRADMAMYHGKRAGGNRYELAHALSSLADQSIDEARFGSQPGVERNADFEEIARDFGAASGNP